MSGSTPLVDAEARRRIREDLNTTFVVEAAAGTGKTTELVARIIAVLASGEGTLGRVVAVTFTEKAAGEMKLRLRSELERARTALAQDDPARVRLDVALSELEAMRIGTIHSLCADLLRERPVEAQVDPVFEVTADGARSPVYERAFAGWFQDVLAAQDDSPGVRRFLRRRLRGAQEGSQQMLRAAGWKLIDHRDFTAPWRRDPDFDRCAAMDALIPALRRLADYVEQAQDPDGWLTRNFRVVRRFCDELAAREQVVADRDYDGLEGQLAMLRRDRTWRYFGRGKFYGPGLARADVVADRDAVCASLDAFLDEANADLVASLREDLQPLIQRYETLKERAGQLDFLDLLVRTRTLIRDHERVRRELQGRFSHLFVDEFQDTDPLQAEILLLLAADDPTCAQWTQARTVPGKLFIVGDPKQSVYRFRRADVALYESTKQRLMGAGAELLHLSTSFRSVPNIQRVVNASFEQVMLGGATQATYVGLAPYREEPETQPSVVALPVPAPYSRGGKVVNYAIDDSLPVGVGAFVHWLVTDSGWTVSEGDERVPMEARHVCLLFKRLQTFGRDITRPYVKALEARQVAHVLVGGHSFHERDEVLALRNSLSAIEWPSDELAVFATLHGPFFSLGDDALLAFRHVLGSLHPLKPIELDDDRLTDLTRPVLEALHVLKVLHFGRNRRPIADTIARLLDATRAHAGLAHWPTGEQALANVVRVMDMARRFESAGATSFRAFVDQLQREAERGDAGDAPIVEEGTDGVRIMSVHRAKGLEFPVVILCDPTAQRTFKTAGLHVDNATGMWAGKLAGMAPHNLLDNTADSLARDDEEGIRLAYVAATRARDLLVLPACGDGPNGGWMDVLDSALYPAFESRRDSAPGPGCPPFGEDSVHVRPAKAPHPNASVRPGLHTPKAALALPEGRQPFQVVWWDPSVLELGVESVSGIRNQWVLSPDKDVTGAEAGVAAYAAWEERRQAALTAGSAPTMAALTITALAHAEPAEDEVPVEPPPVEVAVVAADRAGRPHGKRFGTLVHAVLADAPLDCDTDYLGSLAAVQARVLGAPPEEALAAVPVAAAALQHPVMRRAAAGARCLRETPIVHALEDGTLAEGVVDLAFQEGDGDDARWVVVDFKTDIKVTPPPEYAVQVSLYADAIAEATGQPASGILLMV